MIEIFKDIQVNAYQTPLTEEFLSQYPDEVLEQAFEFITSVEFIKNLISPNRKFAKDLPRDKEGKIWVDLENPHIVEDMDYFRQPALHYMKHKCYTFLKPNSNPHSEYRKYWAEELRRCRDGYIRESDGEWVTGYCYWYLNYNPMLINIIKEGSKKADRIESMPLFFEGCYWRFHYLQQSRDVGKHSIELAKRGASKAHPYNTNVITPEGIKKWGNIQVGDKLFDDVGNITTVIDIPFDDECDIYELTLRDGRKVQASDQHLWDIEVHNRKGIQRMTTLELLDIYKRKRKITDRNPLGVEYVCSIPRNKGVEFQEKPTLVDPYTFGLLLGDGCFRHKSCYFTQDKEDFIEERQHIPYKIVKWAGYLQYRICIPNWLSILKSYGLYNKKSEDKFIPKEYIFNSRRVRLELLRGLMDSDGYIQQSRNQYQITISSKRLIEDIQFLCRSLGYNCAYTIKKAGYKVNGIYKECLPTYCLSIHTQDRIAHLSRKIRKEITTNNEYTINRELRTRIIDIKYIGRKQAKCVTVNNESHRYLIEDFITTHNSYTLSSIMTHNLEVGESSVSKRRTTTVLTAYQKEYLKGDKDGTLSKFQPALSFIHQNTPFPRLMLKESPNEMSWQMGYKDEYNRTKGSLNMVLGVSAKDDSGKLRGKRGTILFEEMGQFKNLDALYDVTRKSVEDGDYAFAQMFLVGTASDSESDFSSAKKLLQAPDGHRIYSLRNVWDKPKQGSPRFGFFYPAYINRMGCFNKDGVSDVIKALFQILLGRYNAKYNNADPQSLLRAIAEDPITPAEAIVKVKAAYFPVAQLNERILQIDSNPRFYDNVLTGDLVLNNGKVDFRPSNGEPIRKWGVDNNTPGCIEIFDLPEKDSEGNIPNTRYIGGVDSYDNDQAESCSLYSIFIFDLFTDNIVAEFTGRTDYADDAHEIARKLALLYNARMMFESNKKGWYAYFAKMNSTHLLAETPQYLRDQQMIKYQAFGSNKYGINASAAINNYGNDLLRQWLISPRTAEIEGEDGKPFQTTIPTLYTIRNRALLDEAANFDGIHNFDRISAMAQVMLYRQEKIILYQGDMSRTVNNYEDKDYAGNDDFFTQNYDEKFNINTRDNYYGWQ